MAFELVGTSKNNAEKVINYFSFPVMPSQISQTEPQITNIKKNSGGITVVNTNTFIPKDISISGSFGRNFRLLIGNNVLNFSTFGFNTSGKGYTGKKTDIDFKVNQANFSTLFKTGYGSMKILQSICDLSVDNDNGVPRKLYFHNPTFGESWLVKVKSLNFTQNQASNMIWNYSLSMTAISPAESVSRSSSNSLGKALGAGVIQNSAQTVATGLMSTFGNELIVKSHL
jgi:hypothetical protein